MSEGFTGFQIGEKYINEKGVFEVLAIDGEEMTIQWENGERATTPLELQTRIQDRIAWERRQEMLQKEKKKSSKKPTRIYRPSTVFGRNFSGLIESDFSTDVTGTHWRSREQLGGAVTARLPSDHFRFNSWSIYRRPEIHWADTRHRIQERASFQAKFFVRLGEGSMIYGFYIERPKKEDGKSEDWEAFIQWLRNDENDQWLNRLSDSEQLTVFDLFELSFSEKLKPSNGMWKAVGEKDTETVAKLSEYLDALPHDHWFDLVIAKTVSKADAIQRGVEIANDISALFAALTPLYEVAASHNIRG